MDGTLARHVQLTCNQLLCIDSTVLEHIAKPKLP
jgi:hypothetical protein